MVSSKTGTLLSLIPRLAAVYGNSDGDLDHWESRFDQMGLYYQIRDDLCNICDPTYWQTKGFFEDLDEGKLSYVVLLCLNQRRTGHGRLRELLLHTESPDPKPLSLKKEAYWILYACGVLHETRDYLVHLQTYMLADALTVVVLGPVIKALYVPSIPKYLPLDNNGVS
jgi:geranylgeranyl pyrophosphate synthase